MAYKNQRIIMHEMDELDKKIDKYAQLISGKFLLEEINKYDAYIKSIDGDLKSADDQLLSMYGKKNAKDEHMSKADM